MYVKEFNLQKGSSVEITEEDGKIVIYPPRKGLDELLSQVTDKTLHGEVDFGSLV